MSYLSHPLEVLEGPHSASYDHQPSDQTATTTWPSSNITSTSGAYLVHSANECDDCFYYTLHVEAVREENSLRHSHRPCDVPLYAQPAVLGAEGTFHEGIALGRRLQREDDDNSFTQYRSRLERLERAEAERDELRRHRFRAEALEQELALVKDALLAAQMAYDDLPQTLYKGHGDPECPRCYGGTRPTRVPTDNEGVDDGGRFAESSATPILDPVRSSMGVAREVWEDVNDFPDVKETKQLLGAQVSLEDSDEDTFLLEQLQALGPHDLEEFWADYRQGHEPSTNQSRTRRPSAQASNLKPIPQSLLSTSDSGVHPAELSIAQVAELIEEADEGLESDAAQIINLLYQDAEQTPKEDRTPAQVFMLLSWNPPKLEDVIDTPTVPSIDKGKARVGGFLPAAPPRLLPSHPQVSALSPLRRNEVFVDASAHGIGLIYGDQWLAWRFTPGHPSIPGFSAKSRTNSQINMSWAELIAAELGIRTCISIGLRDCTVILRSDNGGVVKALKTGTWTSKWGLDVILARVLRLCQSAGLRVVPVWVWGKMNPADAPSRGVYPPKDRMVSEAPVVPPYLTGLVSLVYPDA